VILSGKIKRVGQVWNEGDIITLDPGEGTDFEALADTVCTVVKVPSVKGDKFLE
jgi:hypothetical protein